MDEKNLGRLFRPKKNTDLRRGWRCPDETRLAAYVEGALPAGQKAETEKHLSACDFCLSQVAALLRLADAPMTENVPPALLARARDLVPERATPTVWPIVRWGAVAAVTAAIAIVTTFWHQWQNRETFTPSRPAIQSPAAQPPEASTPAAPAVAPPETAPREVRASQPAAPALDLLAPREGAELARGDREIRWTQVPGSLYYDLRVMTGEGDLVWEAREEGTQARLPANLQLLPGAKYFVSVRAFLADGKSLASPVVGFTVKTND